MEAKAVCVRSSEWNGIAKSIPKILRYNLDEFFHIRK